MLFIFVVKITFLQKSNTAVCKYLVYKTIRMFLFMYLKIGCSEISETM